MKVKCLKIMVNNPAAEEEVIRYADPEKFYRDRDYLYLFPKSIYDSELWASNNLRHCSLFGLRGVIEKDVA